MARHGQQEMKPRFSLGGQVSLGRAQLGSAASASNLLDVDGAVGRAEARRTVQTSHASQAASSLAMSASRQHRGSFHSVLIDSMHDPVPPIVPAEVPSQQQQHDAHSLLLKEFTEDDQHTTQSPSSMFKSSFAKEVVQNVRRSMGSSLSHQNLNSREGHSFDESLEAPVPSSSSTHSIPSTPPMDPHPHHVQIDSPELWMSSTQFVRLLDKTEEDQEREEHQDVMDSSKSAKQSQLRSKIAEIGKIPLRGSLTLPKRLGPSGYDPRRRDSEIKSGRRILEESAHLSEKSSGISESASEASSSASFLDQEARVPFEKLKQICFDLGFHFSESEWRQMQEVLVANGNSDLTLVKNADFFAALHRVMRKRKEKDQLRSTVAKLKEASAATVDPVHGHLLESCRSSSSSSGCCETASSSSSASSTPTVLHLERKLAEKEREVSHFYKQLAERETEMVRVRMECQRLLEDNRNLREELSQSKKHLAAKGTTRRQLELEKEVEHLKWQLGQMESSRKTYEMATNRLVSFLDEVTAALQATSPQHRRLVESTKAEVSRVARRAARSTAQKRYSMDIGHISRAESMPGLNLDPALRGSQQSLSSSISSHVLYDPISSTPRVSHLKSKNSGASSTCMNGPTRVQRSHSTQSKRSSGILHCKDDVPTVPLVSKGSLDEIEPYENISVILMHRQGIQEETEEEVKALEQLQAPSQQLGQQQQPQQKQQGVPKLKTTVKIKGTSSSVGSAASRAAAKKISSAHTQKRHSFVSTTRPPVTMRKESPTTVLGSDKDSGRCSLSSVSGRSTPNISTLRESKQQGDVSSLKDSSSELLDSGIGVSIRDQHQKEKFKSLGNLQIEPALPVAPIEYGRTNPDVPGSDEKKEEMLNKAQKLLKSMKSLIGREKTFTVTPKKTAKSWKPSGGGGSVGGGAGNKGPCPQLLSQ